MEIIRLVIVMFDKFKCVFWQVIEMLTKFNCDLLVNIGKLTVFDCDQFPIFAENLIGK